MIFLFLTVTTIMRIYTINSNDNYASHATFNFTVKIITCVMVSLHLAVTITIRLMISILLTVTIIMPVITFLILQ
jgi:hypothetical protein